MEREGVKEEFDRLKKEKDNRTYERLKLLLKAGKPKPEPRAEENDVTNAKTETEDAIYERPDNIQNQPNISDRNCQLGFAEREVTSKSTIHERAQDLEGIFQSFSSGTTDLAPGSAAEDALDISLGDKIEESESASTNRGPL